MITPFADGETAASIGGLSVENGTEKVAIFGSVDITRDAQGLEHARALKLLVDRLVADLEGRNLSSVSAPTQTASVDKVANPFA